MQEMPAGPLTGRHLPDLDPRASGCVLLLTPLPPPPPLLPPPPPPPPPSPASSSGSSVDSTSSGSSSDPACAGARLRVTRPPKRIYYVHVGCGTCDRPLSLAVYCGVNSILTFEGLLSKDLCLLCPHCEKRYG